MGQVTGIGFHKVRARGTTDLAALRPRPAPGAVLARAWEARAGCVRQSLRHATLGVAMGPLARIDLDYDAPIGSTEPTDPATVALYAAGMGIVGAIGSGLYLRYQSVRDARDGVRSSALSRIFNGVAMALGAAATAYPALSDGSFGRSMPFFVLGFFSLVAFGAGVAIDRVEQPRVVSEPRE